MAATCLRRRRGEAGKGGEAQEGLTAPLEELEGLRGGEKLPATSHRRFSTSSCHKTRQNKDRTGNRRKILHLLYKWSENEAKISVAWIFHVFGTYYYPVYIKLKAIHKCASIWDY